MKTTDFLIFISIVLIVYTSVNYYIFARGSQSLPQIPWLKNTYNIVFVFLFFAYIIHVFLVRSYPSSLCSIFTWTGSFWMGAMLYLFLAIVFIDLLRLVNHFIPFFPAFITQNYEKTKLIAAGSTVFIVAVVILAGFFNAAYPKLKELKIEINKKVPGLERLTIVAASDIHIGNILKNSHVEKLVKRINLLNPDIVLFPGDILDEAIEPVLKYKSGEPLKNIKSKYGVYAITGNHEYIGGINESAPYLKSLGIKLLRDSVALIDYSFYLIGREDRDSRRFQGILRKPLELLMQNIDKSKPVILLDHQPFNLNEAEMNGIDFQLSGHTHHGQLWPINFVTKKIYELSWGYKRKGNTHCYVSSGYGTWGPPVRTGNTPELLVVNVKFNQ
ncbi:metallophosphoesterase [Bacteroidota bacterium]